jgi:hypothetical protein
MNKMPTGTYTRKKPSTNKIKQIVLEQDVYTALKDLQSKNGIIMQIFVNNALREKLNIEKPDNLEHDLKVLRKST